MEQSEKINIDDIKIAPVINPYEPEEAPEELKELEDKLGIKETLDAIKFILALAKSFKLSYIDKEITFSDALNFYEPAKLILPFFNGIEKIPFELADKITEEEKNLIIAEFKKSGILEEKVEEVAVEAIELALQIKNFIFKNFIK